MAHQLRLAPWRRPLAALRSSFELQRISELPQRSVALHRRCPTCRPCAVSSMSPMSSPCELRVIMTSTNTCRESVRSRRSSPTLCVATVSSSLVASTCASTTRSVNDDSVIVRAAEPSFSRRRRQLHPPARPRVCSASRRWRCHLCHESRSYESPSAAPSKSRRRPFFMSNDRCSELASKEASRANHSRTTSLRASDSMPS